MLGYHFLVECGISLYKNPKEFIYDIDKSLNKSGRIIIQLPNPKSIKVSRYVPEGALKKVSAVAVVFVGP